MKKVALKISRYDVEVLLDFLEMAMAELSSLGIKVNLDVKHLAASLAELYNKLQSAYNPFKQQYKLKIEVSQGLALLRYSQRVTHQKPVNDEITFNKLIGLIDKQI